MTQSIALITGGSRGLGRSAALHLAKAGVHIILTYQSDAAAASVVVREIEQGGGRAAAIQLDVADSAGFAQFAASGSAHISISWSITREPASMPGLSRPPRTSWTGCSGFI
jgi:NAD(P)-dependent dehydrogenase (short-subunit alcohol dehydrogenase family)